MDNNNLTIYVCGYKDFTPSVTNKCYRFLFGNHDIKGNYPNGAYTVGTDNPPLDDRFFSELFMVNYPQAKDLWACHKVIRPLTIG